MDQSTSQISAVGPKGKKISNRNCKRMIKSYTKLFTLWLRIIARTGDRGEFGDRGDYGPKGDKGDSGEKGNVGDIGLRGEKGLPGQPGPRVSAMH